MTRTMKSILGSDVLGADGELGRVADVYYDDRHWTVRYLVLQPSDVDRSSQFLLSPIAVARVPEEGAIQATITREQAARAPGAGDAQPVSRQMEQASMDYYGWGYYWEGPELWGRWATPLGLATPGPGARPHRLFEAEPVPPGEDEALGEEKSTLRSVSEVGGYHLQAADGEIGHVEDMLVDQETWRIHCLVVDTRNWWFGKKVTVPSDRFGRIEWGAQLIHVELTRDQIKESQEYDEDHPSCMHTAA
jgi:sporulation protein YlmC with PRC-barrel domain